MNRAIYTLLALSAAFALGSCGDKALRSRPIVCAEPTPPSYASGYVSRADWIDLLLEEPNREKDCSGKWIAPADLPSRCPPSERTERFHSLAQPEEHVYVKSINDGFALVWTPTQEFEDGEAGGPVGLVHVSPKTFSVVALGNLRLPKDEVRLEMQVIRGEEVVFATGTRCAKGADPPRCDTELRLLLSHEGRLVPLELRDSENRCVGATELGLKRVHNVRLSNGWTRSFQLTTSYEIDGADLNAREQLIANDRPPGGDESQQRLFRRSEAKRNLGFTGAYFIYDEPSLWTSMRVTRGELD